MDKRAIYLVKTNACVCHPETCCHKDYYVFDTQTNQVIMGFFNKELAELFIKEHLTN